MIAAANFTYLIGIGLPTRRGLAAAPQRARHASGPTARRAGRSCSASSPRCVWLRRRRCLGFQQFGLPTVLLGARARVRRLGALRLARDLRPPPAGLPRRQRSLHLKLTGAMLLVMALDGAGYLLAVSHVRAGDAALIALLEDIFVAVAILTITVGLVLPGHDRPLGRARSRDAAEPPRDAARWPTSRERCRRSAAATSRPHTAASTSSPVDGAHRATRSARMADCFNLMQDEIAPRRGRARRRARGLCATRGAARAQRSPSRAAVARARATCARGRGPPPTSIAGDGRPWRRTRARPLAVLQRHDRSPRPDGSRRPRAGGTPTEARR